MKKLKKHCLKKIVMLLMIAFFSSCATIKPINAPNLQWQFKDDCACLDEANLIKLKEYLKQFKK